jgi:putative ATP-dependent endonuclease of the OLD family
MRVSKLKIENYRSISSLDEKIPQLCALVGPNNSGKSNVLLTLYTILSRDWITKDAFEENDVFMRQPELDITIEVDLEPPVNFKPFMGNVGVEVPRISYRWCRYLSGERKGHRRLEGKCLDTKDKVVMAPKGAAKKGVKTIFGPIVGVPTEVQEQIPLIYLSPKRTLADQLPSGKYSLLRYLMEDINKDFNDPKNTVNYGGKDIPRAERFKHFIDAAMKLMRTPQLEKLEDSIRDMALKQLGFDPAKDRDKLDFRFGPFNSMEFYKSLDLLIKEGSFEISATELGGGVQNTLVLSIMKAFEQHRKKGAILLIEEPEMFLHPQHQRSLFKTLQAISRDNQVIYTTHSPHFVSIPDYHAVGMVRKGERGTTLRFSTLATNDERSEKLRKELDPERNEFFFASRLLLVEGDTEKLAFPEFAKRLKLDLDRVGASIVEVGGKKSLPEFVSIAESFEIPVAVMYDEDASDFKDEKEEAEFNTALDARETKSGSVKVWRMVKKYEDELRTVMGEPAYQAACQKFPGHSKAIRQRLIAAESTTPVPEKVERALRWLAGEQKAEEPK